MKRMARKALLLHSEKLRPADNVRDEDPLDHGLEITIHT